MLSSDAGRASSRALQRAGWLLHAHMVETKLQALRDAVKYDPNQPRVPAGNPDGGQWTDAGGGGGAGEESTSSRPEDHDRGRSNVVLASFTPENDDEPPKIPKERPRSSRGRTRVYKELATWLARQDVAHDPGSSGLARTCHRFYSNISAIHRKA